MVRPLWSLAGPALGALVAAALLTAPIGTLAGAIQRDLHLSTAAMMVILIPSYAVATVALIAPGYLLGRRWPTATGVPALVFLILGNVVDLLAPDAALVAVGRVVAGLGAGTVVGVAFALSGQLGSWRTRGRLAVGLALGVALLLGPIVSSMLTVTLEWRLVFLVGVPVAAVALAGTVASGIAMWMVRAG